MLLVYGEYHTNLRNVTREYTEWYLDRYHHLPQLFGANQEEFERTLVYINLKFYTFVGHLIKKLNFFVGKVHSI